MAQPHYNTVGQQTFICDTPDVKSVPASTSSVVLLEMNTDRVHAQIFNDSTAVMFLKWGTAASPTSYTTQVPPRGLYELPRVNQYVGPVSAAWAAANGNARVTEAT